MWGVPVNGFDIALLILAGILVFIGLSKGLIRILIGLAALVAAFVLAAWYHEWLADELTGLNISIEWLRIIAYVAIFLAVMLVGGLLGRLLSGVVRAAMLGWADRLGGAALGLVAAALIAAWFILPLVAYMPATRPLLQRSVLAPYVAVVADLANLVSPDDLAHRYRQGVEDLRRHWRGEGEEGEAALSVRNRLETTRLPG